MGAGKTTWSTKLAEEKNAVLISEDEWLATLFPDQIHSFDDYKRFAAQLRPLIQTHVMNLLATGADVVLDFPANTVKQRRWFGEVSAAAGADCNLVYLQASNETCLRQLGIRRQEQPHRAGFDNEAVFNEVTAYFQEPDVDEGFSMQVINKDAISSQ